MGHGLRSVPEFGQESPQREDIRGGLGDRRCHLAELPSHLNATPADHARQVGKGSMTLLTHGCARRAQKSGVTCMHGWHRTSNSGRVQHRRMGRFPLPIATGGPLPRSPRQNLLLAIRPHCACTE